MSFDTQTGYYIVMATLGFTSLYYARAKLVLDRRIVSDKLELQRTKDRTRDLETYIVSRDFISYEFADAVIIGPRGAGKSSLAKMWTNPLTKVVDESASYQWEVYQGDVCEFEKQQREEPKLGLKLNYIPTLRIRVRDYPGEDKFRGQALDDIGKMQDKVVLVLMLLVEYTDGKFDDTRKNAMFYNKVFVNAVNSCLKNSDQKIEKVFAVINRSDLLPADWDDDLIIQKVKDENRSAIENIEQCFGEYVEYKVTSTTTNHNIVNLLGAISIALLPKPAYKKAVSEWMNHNDRIVDNS